MEQKQRIAGALLGFAVGDAMGAATETMTPSEIVKKHGKVTEMIGGGWLKLKPGQITDDTQMMMAVANSLSASNGVPDYVDMANRLLVWLDSLPTDVGLACRRGLEAYRRTGNLVNGDNDSLGNGGLLRVLPFALIGKSLLETLKHVHLTHAADYQARAVQSYLAAVDAALNGSEKTNIVGAVRGSNIRPRGVTSNSGQVRETLSSALNWFSSTGSFEECIIAAVNAGRDSDSVAAIAGGLAGCHYGYDAIPARWLEVLDRNIRNDLVQLADKLTILNNAHEVLNRNKN